MSKGKIAALLLLAAAISGFVVFVAMLEKDDKSEMEKIFYFSKDESNNYKEVSTKEKYDVEIKCETTNCEVQQIIDDVLFYSEEDNTIIYNLENKQEISKEAKIDEIVPYTNHPYLSNDYNENIYILKSSGRFGMYDKKLKQITLPVVYDEYDIIKEGKGGYYKEPVTILKKDNKMSLYNYETKVMYIEDAETEIKNFEDVFYVENEFIFIKSDGTSLIEGKEYDDLLVYEPVTDTLEYLLAVKDNQVLLIDIENNEELGVIVKNYESEPNYVLVSSVEIAVQYRTDSTCKVYKYTVASKRFSETSECLDLR